VGHSGEAQVCAGLEALGARRRQPQRPGGMEQGHAGSQGKGPLCPGHAGGKRVPARGKGARVASGAAQGVGALDPEAAGSEAGATRVHSIQRRGRAGPGCLPSCVAQQVVHSPCVPSASFDQPETTFLHVQIVFIVCNDMNRLSSTCYRSVAAVYRRLVIWRQSADVAPTRRSGTRFSRQRRSNAKLREITRRF